MHVFETLCAKARVRLASRSLGGDVVVVEKKSFSIIYCILVFEGRIFVFDTGDGFPYSSGMKLEKLFCCCCLLFFVVAVFTRFFTILYTSGLPNNKLVERFVCFHANEKQKSVHDQRMLKRKVYSTNFKISLKLRIFSIVVIFLPGGHF